MQISQSALNNRSSSVSIGEASPKIRRDLRKGTENPKESTIINQFIKIQKETEIKN